MPIQVGDSIPAGTLTIVTEQGPENTSAEAFFSKQLVVLFGVPRCSQLAFRYSGWRWQSDPRGAGGRAKRPQHDFCERNLGSS